MSRIAMICHAAVVLSLAASHGHSQQKSAAPPTPPSNLMTPQQLQAIAANAADKRISYGADSTQYGEIRVPTGRGPHPVAILIHGGCFKAAYATASYMSPIGDALKADGIATWNIEYRRLGQPGGGWPNTYLDVARGVDHLRTLATPYNLDLNRVVVVGHSAGGHLAMWTGARSRVPSSSDLYIAKPLRVRGVVDLAGPVDMTANIKGYETLCLDSVITTLLRGTPATAPTHYAHVSPMTLIPLGIPQVIVVGTYEDFVPRPIAERYVAAAAKAGDRVQLTVIPGVGHFEIATTREPTWPPVRRAIRSLIDGMLP